MPELDEPDVFSSSAVRINLAFAALSLALVAWLLVDGWGTWLFTALAVLVACAAITPPFRRTRTK